MRIAESTYVICFKRILIFCLLTVSSLASADSIQLQHSGMDLSALSVQFAESATPDQTTVLLDSTPTSVMFRKRPVFSDGQTKLMQDLSKTIDVIPGGVRLCLNIHY